MIASPTVENYLKAIYLGGAGAAPPRRLMPMGQLASALGVAPGTATTMVKTLAESGLVEYEPYTGVALTKQNVTTRYDVIGHAGLYEYVARSPYDMLNVLGAVFVLAAVWPVWRRFGIAFAVFILINILPPLSAGGLMSAGRFSSVLFPAFFWFASAVPARHRAGWIAAFAAFEAFNAALFYTWRPLI